MTRTLMTPLDLEPGLSVEAISDVWRYAIDGPSKQTRSKVLHAAAAVARGERTRARDPRLETAAAALELCHLGALLHDDAVDGSHLRRGLPSVPAVYGAALAVAAGGGIFGRAVSLMSRCGDAAVALTAEAATCACAGQISELRALYDVHRTPERYIDAIEGKTGGMFWLAARLGGLLEGADVTLVERLGSYGSALGIAFQIVDDILDLVGDERDTGKPRGSDLRNGNYTLPVIYALEECSALAGLLLEETPIEMLIDCVSGTAGLARAASEARRWVKRAKDAIDGLPAAGGLLGIAHAELARLAGVTP